MASLKWVGTDPRHSDLIQELNVLEAATVKRSLILHLKKSSVIISDNIQIVTLSSKKNLKNHFMTQILEQSRCSTLLYLSTYLFIFLDILKSVCSFAPSLI